MTEKTKVTKRKHDAFFRWLFADTNHLKILLELAAKVNRDVYELLSAVNLDTLARIPDSYSEVDDTGEADLAFRVNVSTGAPVLVGVLVEHKFSTTARRTGTRSKTWKTAIPNFSMEQCCHTSVRLSTWRIFPIAIASPAKMLKSEWG